MQSAGHEEYSQGWKLRTKFIVRKTAWSAKFKLYLRSKLDGCELAKLAEKWVQRCAPVNIAMDSKIPKISGSFLAKRASVTAQGLW